MNEPNQSIPEQARAADGPTEDRRRALLVEINSEAADRATLEARHGQVWDASQLANDFEALGFAAPLVVVKRRADNILGSLMFQHHPRYYFCFEEDQRGRVTPD